MEKYVPPFHITNKIPPFEIPLNTPNNYIYMDIIYKDYITIQL